LIGEPGEKLRVFSAELDIKPEQVVPALNSSSENLIDEPEETLDV